LTVNGDADRDTIGFSNLVTIPVEVNGGSGDDDIEGTSASDILNGDSGDDHLVGLGGDDFLDGGPDNDTIFGGDDDDLIDGGQGDDWLDGGRGNDDIAGDIRFVFGELGGNDTIVGDSGNDTSMATAMTRWGWLGRRHGGRRRQRRLPGRRLDGLAERRRGNDQLIGGLRSPAWTRGR
jgi:hypothetical protein